ncbi:hypothetical protein Scep_023885 [Stephania cephalantha]|uniref:Uncharacterized protein n=1 Tax=Stephania cephalantha TaxID=152367 RepID=A0AAP0HXW8_9MAGN
MYAGNSAMASYSHNYVRFEDSHYYNVNEVDMSHNGHQFSNMHSFVQQVEVEEYWSKTAEGLEVFQTEPEIIIAQDEEEENKMKIKVISEKPEEPKKESKEDQHLIFYTADTFVLDDYDLIESFVLDVPNELPILKDGVHVSLPKAINAPFVVDISKREGIT